MSFKDIKGQEDAIRRLKSAIKNNRIAHAYIFAGPRDSGRSLLAKNFAKALNCADPGDPPCDTCASCKKIDKEIHPDVKSVAYNGKGGDITIEQIRELENYIVLKPYEGRYKVFIIEDAHLMNTAAANSFLKTLEEPPANSVLILITERPADLPPTIASRCQVIRARALNAAVKAPDRDQVLDKFFGHDWIEGLNSADRKNLAADLSILAGWYRDILIYKATDDNALIINSDRLDDIKKEGNFYKMSELLSTFDKILKTKEEIENNINPKLALSTMELKCTK